MSTRRRSRFWLFFPFVLLLIVIAAYSAYWAYARSLLDQGIDDWIAAEREAGRTVDYSSKSLGGYPFRFALTVNDPVYADPLGPRWSGEQLQLVMQPWNWNHIIARSPGRNTLTPPAGTGEELRLLVGPKSAASLSWTAEGMRRVSVFVDKASLDAGDEAVGELDQFELHLRPAPGFPDMLQMETHFQAVRLAELPDDVSVLGAEIGPSILRVEVDKGMTAIAMETPADVFVQTVLDLGGEIRVPQIMIDWGPADLGAKGELQQTSAGEIRGQVGLRIEQAEQLRTALDEAGRLDDETRQAIDALEAASANGGFLILTIREDGLYFLGNRIAELQIGAAL